MLDRSLNNYIESLSSDAGTPGGGNAIGLVNAFACGLMLMSLKIAIIKKEGDNIGEALNLKNQLENLQKRSLELAEEDRKVFKEVLALWKAKDESLDDVLKKAAEVSLNSSMLSFDLIRLIGAQDLQRYRNIITDVGIAVEFAQACFRGSMMNYKINIKSIKEKSSYEYLEKDKVKLMEVFCGISNKLQEKIEILVG